MHCYAAISQTSSGIGATFCGVPGCDLTRGRALANFNPHLHALAAEAQHDFSARVPIDPRVKSVPQA